MPHVPLLGPDDPAPYTIFNPDGAAKFLIICDHAGTQVPKALNRLGLGPEHFERHYAVDIGVRAVTEQLSAMMDAPAIVANYSRLVVDLNRPLDHPTTFSPSGEGTPVPGNATMTADDTASRIAEIYQPYHDAMRGMIDKFIDRSVIPPILSIHSFTPVFFNEVRKWEVGVMWSQDRRMTDAMLSFFRNRDFVTGDNEPYDGRMIAGTTLTRQADARRLPNALIEIRNDLIRTPDGVTEFSKLLKEFMNQILADGSIHALYEGPLFTYDPEISRQYFDNLNRKAQQASDT